MVSRTESTQYIYPFPFPEHELRAPLLAAITDNMAMVLSRPISLHKMAPRVYFGGAGTLEFVSVLTDSVPPHFCRSCMLYLFFWNREL